MIKYKDKNLKIGLVIPKFTAGGAEQVVLELAKEYKKLGHNAIVVAMAKGGNFLERFQKNGIEVIELGIERKFSLSLQWLFNRIKDQRKIKNVLENNELDVIHTHLMGPDVDFIYPSIKAKIPAIVYTIHNVYPQFANKRFLERIRNWRRRRAYSKYDKIYAVSDEVRDWTINHHMAPPDQITTIVNGINFSRLDVSQTKEELRKKFGWGDRETVILNVGSHTEQKNQRMLLNTGVLLLKKGLNIRIIIAGDGPLRELLEKEVFKLGLRKKVELLGVREDIPLLLKASDIFAFPSFWEGLPIALLEALGSGIPVIASDIPIHRNILNNGKYGWLTPINNPKDIADNILLILNNRTESQEKAVAGQNMVKEKFSSQTMAKNYLDSYYQLLEKKESKS